METNKEIITYIIEDLENKNLIKWPTGNRTKLTKEKLVECWSIYGNEEYKELGYTNKITLNKLYRKIFNIENKPRTKPWKIYILELYNFKYCDKCNKLYKLNNMTINKKTTSGYSSWCLLCNNLYNKKYSKDYYNENKDIINEKSRVYYKNNKSKILELQKEYNSNNTDYIKEYQKIYRENNYDKIKELKKNYYSTEKGRNQNKYSTAKRRAEKIKRTPKWADLEKIREIYKKCPDGHHVDHIIPLQGKLVSGLHVEDNLQYLTAKENLSKSNKFEV